MTLRRMMLSAFSVVLVGWTLAAPGSGNERDARARVHVTHRIPPKATDFDRELLADIEELVELELADAHGDAVEVVAEAESSDVMIVIRGLLEDQKQLSDEPVSLLNTLEVKYEYEITQRVIVDVARGYDSYPFEASSVTTRNWCESCREWEGRPQLFRTTKELARQFVERFLPR